MYHNKQAQITMEFLVLVGFIFTMSFIFIAVAGERFQEFTIRERSQVVDEFAKTIRAELEEAAISRNGYMRNLTLPDRIDSIHNYSLRSTNRTITVFSEYGDYSYPIPEVVGDMQKGLNIIRKKRDQVVITHTTFSPLSHWGFNERSGNSSDYGNIVPVDTKFVTHEKGYERKGIRIDNGDYGEITHDAVYQMPEGTVALWFNADNLAGLQGLWSKDSNGFDAGGHLSLYLQGANPEVRLQSSSADYYATGSAINSGEWYSIIASFGGYGLTLYINGKEVDSDPYVGDISLNTEPIAIGVQTTNSGDGTVLPIEDTFEGYIDEVMIFNRQLTAAEILDLSRQ